ncbi:glycosyltransferase family 2 protein [Nocardioides sp. L-11A]|uniref:glycosyltransferase family 2 protein n=1 Tax=Nocardioides sp. L-11A TaxID=3043848 RepID=UPI00249A39A9|nr:glycosyltransferase family 2 protein [Nocardioides sp. L-11A]
MTRSLSSADLADLDIAVVLPAYNEEATIAETIRDFHGALPAARIHIIDNRSSDATAALAAQTLEELGCPGSVLEELRPGKGNAVRRAFVELDADVFVLADADLTYPASDVLPLLEPVVSGRADMVVGDRMSGGHYARENKRSLHNAGNNFIKGTINRLFGADLVDITSGYRVFSRRFVRTYPVIAEGFEIEADLTMHALHHRLRVVELPINYVDRPPGSVSKLRTVSDGARVLFTIAQIVRFYRPLRFFSFAGILIALAGAIAAVPVIQDWFQHNYIYHVPLAILATGLCLMAMLMVAIGFVLDSVAHNERLGFERRWIDTEKRVPADARRRSTS